MSGQKIFLTANRNHHADQTKKESLKGKEQNIEAKGYSITVDGCLYPAPFGAGFYYEQNEMQ